MSFLPDYDSPLALKAFLDDNGMAMQKKFGQNFLVNRKSRQRLVDALSIGEGSKVWEIGPGLGAMTEEILSRGAQLTVFEIDRGFARLLKESMGENPRFSIIEGDVLKTWKNTGEAQGFPDRLFGNLPYNIAAEIIASTIQEGIRFERAVVTVQKEVAVRMCAKPDSRDYSSFSVLCQWAYTVSPLMDLAGGNFWPRPNVDSRAVVMKKNELWPGCLNPSLFMKLQRALFSSRRKTVLNNLKPWLISSRPPASLKVDPVEILHQAGIDPGARAETLAIQDFLRLSDVVEESWA